MSEYHRARAGNWYRGGANWLENKLNGTLDKHEPHDDRAMMRDAMGKLNQAADEIDRLYQIEKERDELAAHVQRCHHAMQLVENGPQFITAKACRGLRMARERKPQDALDELKAQWQAEILEQIASEHFSFSDAQLEARAAELRRQAEGNQ